MIEDIYHCQVERVVVITASLVSNFSKRVEQKEVFGISIFIDVLNIEQIV